MPVPVEAFPAPRPGRIGGPAPGADLGAGGLPAPPRTRVFPFSLLPGSSLRSSRSTPRIRGPAIIRALHLTKNGSADGVLGFGLGKASSPVTETGVAITTTPPFTVLFEGLQQAGAGPTSPNNTVVSLDVQAAQPATYAPLDIVVEDEEWYLVVYAASNASATPDTIVGYVVVLEGVSEAALRNFL